MTGPPASLVDLRETPCFQPYAAAEDQGDEGACLAYAMNSAFGCAQRKAGIDRPLDLDEDRFFRTTRTNLGVTRSADKGITFEEAIRSFDSVIERAKRNGRFPEDADVEWTSLKPAATASAVRKAVVKQRTPVVVGIRLNPAAYEWQNEQFDNDGDDGDDGDDDDPSPPTIFPPGKRYVREIDDGQRDIFHSVLVVGATPEGFLLRNSWGDDWGDDGHFFIGNASLDAILIEAFVGRVVVGMHGSSKKK